MDSLVHLGFIIWSILEPLRADDLDRQVIIMKGFDSEIERKLVNILESEVATLTLASARLRIF